ncbi:MAG: hypothetical protein RLZZ339_1207 [Cyanobacteriota bacterium]
MSGKSLLILILCLKMNNFDIHSLITTVDNLIFSYTGENLDDVQSEILEGVINHQKYTEIAKNHHRSEKYVKDVAGKLWKTLSEILGEEVNKANLRSSLRRYYYNVANNNVVNGVQINKGHICNQLPENQLQKFDPEEEYKLEIATELMKEGLTVEQIARVLKLPLELVKEQLEKPKQPN